MCFRFPAILAVQVAEVLPARKYQRKMKRNPSLVSSIWVQKTAPQPSALALVMGTGVEEGGRESSRGKLHKSVSLKSNPAAGQAFWDWRRESWEFTPACREKRQLWLVGIDKISLLQSQYSKSGIGRRIIWQRLIVLSAGRRGR